jgi:WD40 repeat protein
LKALVSQNPLLRASRLLTAAGLAWTVLAGLAAGDLAARRTAALSDEARLVMADATTARASGYRIVLASDLDGDNRGYTIEPDGSRLTPLVSRDRRLTPFGVSRDGRTIAYSRSRVPAIYVSRGNGTGLRFVVTGLVTASISPDGRRLAYAPRSGPIAIIGTNGRGRRVLSRVGADTIDWSPDGRALAYTARRGNRTWVVVHPLRGRPRVLSRSAAAPKWSPDGRRIAVDSRAGLQLLRPDGRGGRRIGLRGEFSWSPDGRRLAVGRGLDISVVRSDGRVSWRLRLKGPQEVRTLLWAPDGRNLLVELYPPNQIFIVGANGKGLRRVTRLGNSTLVGWTRVPPARPPLPPLFPTERLAGPRTVSTRTPITTLSADGGRVVFAAMTTAADCGGHVAVWTPATRELARPARPAPCREWPPRLSVVDVELAGDRLAWVTERHCPNTCDTTLDSRLLTARRFDRLSANGSSDGYPVVRGDGSLLVFGDGRRLVRIGLGSEQCQEDGAGPAQICTTLRRGDHAGPVDSVGGGLIAVREQAAVAVLDERGALVRVFAFGAGEVNTARLDGGRLVVNRADEIEVYDISTGTRTLQRPMPKGFGLEDVDGGVAVLLNGKAIMLVRLQDGESRTMTPGRGSVLADLESSGLYYSYGTADGGGRVVFMPRAEAEPAQRAG